MNVMTLEFNYLETREPHIAFLSDLHIEALDHNRKLLDRDLTAAADLGARMLFNGDIMDMILPGDRKRYVKGSDTLSATAGINEVIERGVELLGPYVDFIDGIGVGNHESAVVKYHSVDPVQWLLGRLNSMRSPSLKPIAHMGYTGYVRVRHVRPDGGSTKTLDIWYHHGVGGASPVTKGMIDFNRAVYANDASVYWMGHKHVSTIDPDISRMYLDREGNPYFKTIKAFYTAGYKGGMIHEQMRKGSYEPDFSTERFLNHSSTGMVVMKMRPEKYGIATQLFTPMC